MRAILTYSLHGLYDTTYPTISNGAANWFISVPSAYILSTVFKMGITGIALGQCIGSVASNVLLLPRWYKKSDPQRIATLAAFTSNRKRSILRSMNWCFWKKSASTEIDPQNQIYQIGQISNPVQ